MEDLIKRKDAIKAEADRVYKVLRSEGCKETYEDCLADAEKTFEDIPSAEKQGEWIPCSERLPSGYEQVLVNVIEQNRVYDIVLCYTELVEKYYARGMINAWMPLPEPWKGADDE